MPSSLDVTHARWVLGLLPPQEAPQFAWDALVFGYDGPLLRLLASLSKPSKWEVDQVFFPAIREMGFETYTEVEACRVLADDAAERILEGELDAVDGASQIRDFWVRSGYIEELSRMALPFETLLCSGRRDEALRLEILQVVRAHQPST